MEHTKVFCRFALLFCGLVVSGCGSNPAGTPAGVITAPSTGGGSTAGTTTGGITSGGSGSSVYVVSDATGPSSVLAFPQSASGLASPSLNLSGSLVSLDGAGNIYVLSDSNSSIDEYPANAPYGNPSRSLPVGPETNIAQVEDVMASTTGEIFVSDGKGIAVFSATAAGNTGPTRYIVATPAASGSSTNIVPGVITVDSADNLYVQNTVDSSVLVFGPTDTGTVAPKRIITGPLTRLSEAKPSYITSMATDTAGNLYVLCLCAPVDAETSQYFFGVIEFGPTANGNVAPIRQVTTSEWYPYFYNDALAVDSAGTIYVSAGLFASSDAPTVFEFPASASGNATPSNTVSLYGWSDAPESRIAVH